MDSEVLDSQVGAPASCGAAPEKARAGHVVGDGPAEVLPDDIRDVEGRGVARLTRVAGEGLALSDEERLAAGAVELDVLQHDVTSVTRSTASAVWRVSDLDAGPGFEVAATESVVQGHVPREKVLNVLELANKLTDRAHGDACAAKELAVVDEDVTRIRLQGDRVVTVHHHPAAENDVIRVHRIRSISVE